MAALASNEVLEKLTTGSGFEVDGGDVVKLVLQFLQEQGLVRTARELQAESGIALNTVENRDQFIADIRHGRWDSVLPAVGLMKLPSAIMIALYEQVVLELVECRELDLAREMLRSAPPLQMLRKQEPERFMGIDNLCGRKVFDVNAAFGLEGGKGKEKRRHALAERISPHVTVVPASRLLCLVGQALKFQEHNGLLPKSGQFDLFSGIQKQMEASGVEVEEKAVKRVAGQIRFGSQSHCEVACYSPDGTSVVTASADGFIEVWDLASCKLRRDLPYQAVPDDERFMMHDKPIHALAFARNGTSLASGDTEGKIKVWRLATGKRLKLFDKAHLGAVTSICFNTDGTQVLSGGFDGTARVHGLKSGKMLKEFKGHEGMVKSAVYMEADSKVITASEGSVRVFESLSCECLKSFQPGGVDFSLHTLIAFPDQMATALMATAASLGPLLLVAGRGKEAWVVSLNGTTVRTLSSSEFPSPFVGGCLSTSGQRAYMANEKGEVHCFDVLTSKIEQTFIVLEKDDPTMSTTSEKSAKRAKINGEVLGLSHHPHRNLLASYANDGVLKLWRP